MPKRTGWSKLSIPYRRRLERQGISRAAWERGANLTRARGHAPKAPETAAPIGPTVASVLGEGTTEGNAILATWRATAAPRWLPGPMFMANDVAAELSQLRRGPDQWKHVTLIPTSDGSPWSMVVEFRRGYPQEVFIPAAAATEVLELLSQATPGLSRKTRNSSWENLGITNPKEWQRWVDEGRNFDVADTV